MHGAVHDCPGRRFMFSFIWEQEFEKSLVEIEPCPYCADRLMRQIERCCSKEVTPGSCGYGFVRVPWRFHRLLMWYFVFNLTISVLDIAHEIAIHCGNHRYVA